MAADDRSGSTELRIDQLTPGGDGLSRRAGEPVVFVADSAPGDLLRVALSPLRRGHRRGRLLEVLEPGPGRREPPCPEAGTCGGCQWQHLDDGAQVAAVEELLGDCLRRIGGFDLAKLELPRPSRPGPALGYRQRARFALDLAARPPRLGFLERESHVVHHLNRCPVLSPELEALRQRIASALDRLAASIPGVSRAELQLDCPAEAAVVARLVLGAPRAQPRRGAARSAPARASSGGELAELAESLLDLLGSEASVEVVDGLREVRAGAARLGYRRGPLEAPSAFPAFHAPGGFLQASRAGNAALVSKVLQLADLRGLGPEPRVLELFSGDGNFTLPLAAEGARLSAVETEASAVSRCAAALQAAGLAAELACAPAERELERRLAAGERLDLVVLDPPRLGAKTCARLLAPGGARRIVWVSCDAPSFARDARILAEGGWTLRRVDTLLLFPQTAHFETVALLERPSPSPAAPPRGRGPGPEHS